MILPAWIVAGLLALAFARWRSAEDSARRVGARLAIAGASALVIFSIVQGFPTLGRNSEGDDRREKFTAEVARDRGIIAASLMASRGRERAWLDSAVRANIDDRAFLLAALPNDSISPELIDTLAGGQDFDVTLEAIRNPNARPETLARVYRSASYPGYFFQALAAHRNTPPGVLRALYSRRATITGLDIWFAGNPSTPKEILRDVAAKTTDRIVVAALLENPALDCATLTQLSVNLMKVQNRDADDPGVARINQRLPEVCSNTTRD